MKTSHACTIVVLGRAYHTMTVYNKRFYVIGGAYLDAAAVWYFFNEVFFVFSLLLFFSFVLFDCVFHGVGCVVSSVCLVNTSQ